MALAMGYQRKISRSRRLCRLWFSALRPDLRNEEILPILPDIALYSLLNPLVALIEQPFLNLPSNLITETPAPPQ